MALSSDQLLLLKQEPYDVDGQTNGELLNEWHVHQLVDRVPGLHHLKPLISQAIAFDYDHSILTLHYRADYRDLEDLYGDRPDYPPAIAQALGATLAEIHRSTLNCSDAKDFLSRCDRTTQIDATPDVATLLEPVTPETFGTVTSDGLKFYQLMQRYESLGRAIQKLHQHYQPCCLIHGDLKFRNLLVYRPWELHIVAGGVPAFGSLADPLAGTDAPIRLIDWEKWRWGDPAFDLGCLVADYLKGWLKSLTVSSDIPIELALHLATTPLEQVQPSMVGLIQAYVHQFPEIRSHIPDFLSRVMGFAGLALIQSIQAHIHYYEPFGNVGICMLQVAKTLLCTPETALQTVLGKAYQTEACSPSGS